MDSRAAISKQANIVNSNSLTFARALSSGNNEINNATLVNNNRGGGESPHHVNIVRFRLAAAKAKKYRVTRYVSSFPLIFVRLWYFLISPFSFFRLRFLRSSFAEDLTKWLKTWDRCLRLSMIDNWRRLQKVLRCVILQLTRGAVSSFINPPWRWKHFNFTKFLAFESKSLKSSPESKNWEIWKYEEIICHILY